MNVMKESFHILSSIFTAPFKTKFGNVYKNLMDRKKSDEDILLFPSCW